MSQTQDSADIVRDQLALFDVPRISPRGWPLCEGCGREGIGPNTPWCYADRVCFPGFRGAADSRHDA